MATGDDSRYRRVSRRALLKTSLGAGVAAATAAACGTSDSEIFAGRVAETIPSTTTPPTTTTATTPTEATAQAGETAQAGATAETEQPTTPATLPEGVTAAVVGEMVISFTYTQGVGGRDENPYIAVWIEDFAGDLVETVALFYEQSRRGRRWIDHLDRWFTVDARNVAAGGADDSTTISSATRPPGAYAVAWDGTADGAIVPAGDYFVCVESAREPGAAYGLIREPVRLDGTLAPTELPDTGELSMASVLINV